MIVDVPYDSRSDPVFIHMPKYQVCQNNFNFNVVRHVNCHIRQKTLSDAPTLDDAYTPTDFINKARFFAYENVV